MEQYSSSPKEGGSDKSLEASLIDRETISEALQTPETASLFFSSYRAELSAIPVTHPRQLLHPNLVLLRNVVYATDTLNGEFRIQVGRPADVGLTDEKFNQALVIKTRRFANLPTPPDRDGAEKFQSHFNVLMGDALSRLSSGRYKETIELSEAKELFGMLLDANAAIFSTDETRERAIARDPLFRYADNLVTTQRSLQALKRSKITRQ